LNDYFEEKEYIADDIRFHYLGGLYSGHGILTWNPENGFHLKAFVIRSGPPLPKYMTFGGVRVVPKTALRPICMRLRHSGRAVAANALLIDRLDVVGRNFLTINLPRVIFFGRTNISAQQWVGSALYETGTNLLLPDTVHREVLISGEKYTSSQSTDGIRYDTLEHKIVGITHEDHYLEFDWSLSCQNWSKNHSWQWGESARYALAIILGRTIDLLKQEVYRGDRQIIDIRKRQSIQRLAPFLPLGIDYKLDKDIFIRLTEFFMLGGSHVQTCRNIINQMAEASAQKSDQATELLLSTVLEAVLRNVYQHPFRPGDNSFDVGVRLNQFRQQFLSDQWKTTCVKVLEARKRLRHRNAHPDWLFTQGGSLSDGERAIALEDMIFLSRFYGCMILALAGYQNLEPLIK
jgi:hypothetical protein